MGVSGAGVAVALITLFSSNESLKSFVGLECLKVEIMCHCPSNNLMIWMKTGFIEAVEIPQDASEATENAHRKTTEMLQSRGLKRLKRDILAIPGKVCVEGKKVVGIRIHPLYPMIAHVSTACNALFQQYEMVVLLDKT